MVTTLNDADSFQQGNQNIRADKDVKAELNIMLNDIYNYCLQNNIPVFVATWLPPMKKKDDGYIYELVSPMRLSTPIDEDRFPQFLGGIIGFDRTQFY